MVATARSASGEAPQRRAARVVAITSGKGGVGKTNVAVNLAARLARMARRVIVLDADLGLANADVVCNVGSAGNLAHVVAGRRKLEDVMVDAPGGFSLIPGASGLSQMAAMSEFERARLLQMLRQIESEHDLIIIDTGAGISPNVLSFVLAADEILVVTTPEPTSVTDAYAMIKTISRRSEAAKVGLLVNMAKDRAEARRVFERMNAVCRRFLGLSLTSAGYVVNDPHVGLAVRRRRLFALEYPECPAGLCMTQLAHRLDRHAAEPRESGFFQRVASWLAG
jgi:flagellar biosynthesis protein FlhG